jgi:hypothetical protein
MHSWGSESHDNHWLSSPQTLECCVASRVLDPLLIVVADPGSGMSGITEPTLDAVPRCTRG